jgi:hypothetical protein
MNLTVFSLVLFGNLWVWRILSSSFLLGLAVILVSMFLCCLFNKKTGKNQFWFVILMILLLVFQWQTTEVRSLTNLSNDEQRVQHMRLKEYPPVYIKLAGKTLWIPLAHWFEGRRESIAFFRILNNLSEVIDPNLYFFSNHPRERVGVTEFEKFPYVLLPFFVVGMLKALDKQKKRNLLLVSFIFPVLLIALIGNQNKLGPFSLFPFIAIATSNGLEGIVGNIKQVSIKKRKIIITGLLVAYLLVFLQMISYAIS